MSSLIKLYYQQYLSSCPHIVQGVRSAIICCTGDAIAQIIVEEKKKYDFKRTFKWMLIGFGSGLIHKRWFRFLDNRFSSSKFSTVKKVAVDQLLFSPTIFASTLASIRLLQGDDLTKLKQKFERDYFEILFTSYKMWPAVLFINFYLIPLRFQVTFVQLVGIIWSTYISLKTCSTEPTVKSIDHEPE